MNIAKLLFTLLFISTFQVYSQTYKKDDKVEIEYSGSWYSGYIMETKDNQYKIHYDGYDSGWEEWVETSRLRSTSVNPTTKVEETKQVEQKTTETAVQVKNDLKVTSDSRTATQGEKVTFYSFTKDGAPITTFDCESSPKELWAHIYVPAEAFEYDKLIFEVRWLFKIDPDRPHAIGTWEYDIENCESLKTDSLLHIQILDPNNTKDQVIKNWGGTYFVQNNPKGKPTFKGVTSANYYSLCVIELINSYMQCALAGVKVTGTRQVWETQYTDGSGEGWWETQNVYGPQKILDDYENSDELKILILPK